MNGVNLPWSCEGGVEVLTLIGHLLQGLPIALFPVGMPGGTTRRLPNRCGQNWLSRRRHGRRGFYGFMLRCDCPAASMMKYPNYELPSSPWNPWLNGVYIF